MEADIFGKSSLKTYARAKKRCMSSGNAMFSEKALQSLKENVSSPDGKKSTSKKGKRKGERNKDNILKVGSLKKLKRGKNKKATLQVKIQRKATVKNTSPLQDSYENDMLFGKGLQPVKAKRKSRARKSQKGSSIQKSDAEGGRRSSVLKLKSQEQSELSLPGADNSKSLEVGSAGKLRASPGDHALCSVMESKIPPGSELRPEDKVSDWLAKSDESSKEVFRGEQQVTGDEMRNKLFPEAFFENLNYVLQKPKSAHISKHVKARKDEFLSQLALKNVDKPLVSGPRVAATQHFMNDSDEDDEDIPDTFSSAQSELQTYTQTGTGSQMITGTATFSTGTGTGTSRVTETQSHCLTETGTQMETDTYSYPTSTGTSKLTETQSHSQIGTVTCNFPADTNGDTHTPTRSLCRTKPATVPTAGGRNSMETKSKAKTTEAEQTFTCKDPKVQKYLSSTMRRSTSLNKAEFPSELSAVTDSLRNQQPVERTPEGAAEKFKIPRSPTKSAAFKAMRKGTLQPKNSTKLFTTGFMEIVDVIPQMSTITNEHSSKVTEKEEGEEEIEAGRPKQRQQTIKTSTPNKVDSQGQAFQFDIDISSVNMDSEDDDLLHFHESREVNSEEFINLSDTLIHTQQDETIQAIDVDPETSREMEHVEPAGVEVPSNTGSTVAKANTGTTQKNFARVETSAIEKSVTKISIKTKKGKEDMEKKLPAVSDVSKIGKRKVSDTRKQEHSDGLKKHLRGQFEKSLKVQNAKTSLQNTVSRVSRQSVNSRVSNSRKLPGNIQKGVKDGNNKRKKNHNDTSDQLDIVGKDVYDIDESEIDTLDVVKGKDDSLVEDDVFDIEESAKPLPSSECQKFAKGKPKKKALTINKKPSKTNTSELFNPKCALNFNSISYSTISSKSLGSLFGTHGQNSISKTKNPLSHPQRWDSVPVCTLMNEDFSCPTVKTPFVIFKTIDTRSHQEILDTVATEVAVLQ